MSFIPIDGPARLLVADLPRDSQVEFTSAQSPRTITLGVTAAMPVLTQALRGDDADPSVRLLAGGLVEALKLVAARRVHRSPDDTHWQAGPLTSTDRSNLRGIAEAFAPRMAADVDETAAMLEAFLDAVADSMTKPPSRPVAPISRTFEREIAEVVRDITLSIRIEAPSEELGVGDLVGVLQVSDADDLSTIADAADVWLGDAPGFGVTAKRRLASLLRKAARAWPPLEEVLSAPVPDRITLDSVLVADLLDGGVTKLLAQGIDVFWPRSLDSRVAPTARVQVRGDPKLQDGVFGPGAVFEFDWRLALHTEEGEEPLTDEEMSQLAHASTAVIRLRDNWVVVDPKLARRARRRLNQPKNLGAGAALAATLTGRLQLDDAEIEVHPGATLEKVRRQVDDAKSVASLPQPPGLKATLREYQLRGLTWLAELTGLGLGAVLADDMGLGKTITLIALHLHRRDRGMVAGPTLVVCPASLLGNWEAELHRFAPDVPVIRFHGSARDLAGAGTGFVLTTYGTMRVDHEALAEVSWDLVVADEAQHIKNSRSSTARHLRAIGSKARVALTGTPVENDLSELWAILDWADPGLLGSLAAFRKRWAAPIESDADPAVVRQFAQLVDPFILRRRKSDPGIAPELPAKTETDHLVGLTREQVVLYEATVREAMERVEKAPPLERRGLILALLTALKQICNHPAHYLRQPAGRLNGRSEKFALLEELLGTILSEDGAVLLFTQYVAMAQLIERHLESTGVPSLFLHGGTPVRDRERMVADFQAGNAPVFLLSLKAGGTGLNLTRADHVIHFDRWWNPAVEDQATDRAYRIGQTKPVQVHRLVTQGTVEERVGELLRRKRTLADAVLGSGEAALTELDNDELRDLVTLRTPYG